MCYYFNVLNGSQLTDKCQGSKSKKATHKHKLPLRNIAKSGKEKKNTKAKKKKKESRVLSFPKFATVSFLRKQTSASGQSGFRIIASVVDRHMTLAKSQLL